MKLEAFKSEIWEIQERANDYNIIACNIAMGIKDMPVQSQMLSMLHALDLQMLAVNKLVEQLEITA